MLTLTRRGPPVRTTGKDIHPLVFPLTFPSRTHILCLQRPLFREATLIHKLSWELYIHTSLLLIRPPENNQGQKFRFKTTESEEGEEEKRRIMRHPNFSGISGLSYTFPTSFIRSQWYLSVITEHCVYTNTKKNSGAANTHTHTQKCSQYLSCLHSNGRE